MAQCSLRMYCNLQYSRHFLYRGSADHLVKTEVFCSSTKTTTITTMHVIVCIYLDAAPCHDLQNMLSSLLPFSCYLCHSFSFTTFLASIDSSIRCDCTFLDAAPCHDAQNTKRTRPLTTLTASTDGRIMRAKRINDVERL